MREIDPAWWRSAAFDARPLLAYLKERDFGAVFRFLRSRGWSRSTIAAATGLSETRVREISVGRQRVTSYEVLERIALGLDIDRGLLGIAYEEGARRSRPDDGARRSRPDTVPPPGPAGEIGGEADLDPCSDHLESTLLGTTQPVRPTSPIQGLIDVLTDYHVEYLADPSTGRGSDRPAGSTEVGERPRPAPDRAPWGRPGSGPSGRGPASRPAGSGFVRPRSPAVGPGLPVLTAAGFATARSGPPGPGAAGSGPRDVDLGPNGFSNAERETAGAKRDYQNGSYDAVLRDLPSLLVRLSMMQAQTAGPTRADALAAHAYHVAGSVLLKIGEASLAAVAADRSMSAAQRSGDPITVAASARIVTHSLMSAGHNERARYLAITAADELVREVSLERSKPAQSVYGALLLRASVACARDNSDMAHDLLHDADLVARTLSDDANERWTAFGPTNVLLHRVHVALALGDAGSAIRTARQIDLGRVTLAERKASLFLDVARAFQQCGRHDEAFDALDVVHRTAPEEIRSRPAAERLVAELASSAPPSTAPRIRRLARSAGLII